MEGININNKIYFLHIPKTAGTAFNETFRRVLPSRRYFEHMESSASRFQEIVNDGEPFYASGHFTFDATKDLVERQDIFSITILRDPLRQLISHLKWVKAYGDPDNPLSRRALPDEIADLSMDLWRTDLNDVERLSKVLDRSVAKRLFDNIQTRYLTNSSDEPVNIEQLDRSIENIRSFDFIFTIEDAFSSMNYLSLIFPRIGQLQFVNSARISDSVDLSNKSVSQYYRSFVTFDTILYDHVLGYSRAKYQLGTEFKPILSPIRRQVRRLFSGLMRPF